MREGYVIMAESVHGTVYIARCTRSIVCRYKSEKLYVGSQYGIKDVDYIPVGCTTCQNIFTINTRDPKPPKICPTCKEPLHFYLVSGADIPQANNLCPKCQHDTLNFEIAGFMR